MTTLNVGNLKDFKTEIIGRSEKPYFAYLSFLSERAGDPLIFIRKSISVQAAISGAILKYVEVVGEAMIYDEEALKKLEVDVEKARKKIVDELNDELSVSVRIGWFE